MNQNASITALMSAFGRAFHVENEEHPVFADHHSKELMTAEEYLSAEAIDAMLSSLFELCADGSALVFDYPGEDFFDAPEKRVQNTIMMAKAGGEPMKTVFSYSELETLLEKHGFLIYELLTPDDIQRNIIDKAGADMKAFEHVNYCLAVRKD